MAAHFGCHPWTVCHLAKKAGLRIRKLGWRPKVTLADFRNQQEIAAMRALAARENTALKVRTR